jgi:hypothetical protein
MWKTVCDYPNYKVTKKGSVIEPGRFVFVKSRYGVKRKYKPTRVLTQTTHRDGYQIVKLVNEQHRKNLRVHRLVAIAFLGDNRHLEVDHLSGDKTDNSTSNLEWVTRQENMNRCHANNPHIVEKLVAYGK